MHAVFPSRTIVEHYRLAIIFSYTKTQNALSEFFVGGGGEEGTLLMHMIACNIISRGQVVCASCDTVLLMY